MKPTDSTINYVYHDVHVSKKCTDKSSERVKNPASQKTVLSGIAYDNIYNKKPIFRRKLIEKYSSARYNFNTKRVYGVQTVSKKKCDDSSYSSGNGDSKNTRYHINRTGIAQNSVTYPRAQPSVDTDESFLSVRHDTVVKSTDCGVTLPRRGGSSVSTRDEDVNLKAKLTPSRRVSDCIKNEKTSKTVSAHPDCKLPLPADVRCPVSKTELPDKTSKSTKNGVFRSDLRAMILSRARPTESSDTLLDSRSSKNFDAASSSFSDSENSDSCESTYLTISYDGDSDSKYSFISDEEYFEDSYDKESVEKVETRDVEESTAKQPGTDSRVSVKKAESHLSLKKSNTNKAGLKLSDSDSDSGLQLCSSDGEKSCSDQPLSGGQKIDFAKLMTENVAKSHKHPFSFKNTNDWVNNSNHNLDQLELNSGLNIPASSAQTLLPDRAGQHLSLDSNAVSAGISVDVPNSMVEKLSSCDSNKEAKTSEVKTSGATRSKPIISCESQLFDVPNRKQLAEKITESLNCDRPEKSSLEETSVHSNICEENSCQDSVLLNQTLKLDAATNSEYKKSIEKWKLVPSTIYQHLAEHYETQVKDEQLPIIPKKKRKKGTWKNRLGSTRRSIPAKKIPEEPVEIPYRDPYADTLNELEIKEESADEPLTENIGMILHVGVSRPLFPEIYRNIIALNERTDGEITDLWANFALTTLITDKSSKRFRSVFLPVVDTKLKSAIETYQQKTSSKFQEVGLQKVTFVESPEENRVDGSSRENVCPRKRKIDDSFDDTSGKLFSPEKAKSSPKKQKTEESVKCSLYQVDFPTIPITAQDISPKSSYTSHVNHLTESPNLAVEDSSCANHLAENLELAVEDSSLDVQEWKTTDENSTSAVEYLEPATEKLSDEALLAKHGYKPCWVLLSRIPVPCSNTYAEEDEEDDNEHHFFGADHCSRTYGQMLDYRSRNLSLVFFLRIKRILRLQRQNNKLFHSCQYVRLQPNIEDESDEVDLLDDCPDAVIDSKPFAAEVTKNPLDIMKTWKLNVFEAPLLKGIDVNANKFPIRFMNHQLLKSETNAKWFILQLNKCLLNVIHHDSDCLPIELLFQIICRADLTKKVVCNTIGMEFNPDILNFGVYGVPGLSEAVLVGPYESRETQHDLTATVQLWNRETASIPILETSFDMNTFFLWSEDTKVRSVYGLWWKPGDAVPCTSAANSTFMNHLFNPAECESSTGRSVKVQSLLRQHPCLTYSKYDRGGHDMNFRLIHQVSKLNYTASGLKVSQRMALEDFVVDDCPLLQPTKLRSRTNMPNYCEMVSPKMRLSVEPKSDVKKESKILAPRVPVRALSSSERLKLNTVNERLRRKEFSILRSRLRTTVEASQDASLISILNKAQDTAKSLEKDENMWKRSKRSLFYKRKKLIGKLRANMKQYPADDVCYRSSIELILNLGKCDRAENYARTGLSIISAESSNYAAVARINSDEVRHETSKEHSTTESSKQRSPAEFNKQHSTFELSKRPSTAELSKQHSAKRIDNAPAPNRLRLKRSRNVNKCLWRKVVESRLEPRPQHRPTASESSENCSSPEDVLRAEHSYSKRQIGLRPNGRWASNGIPRKEYQKLMASPSSLLVRCDQQASESSSEHDQVAVYLTENDLPITKLVIQRLKSVNENSRHLSPMERRNQIIALIRKIVRETLTGTRSQAGSANQDERFLVPRLLLLQRLLEGANIKIRDSSKIRVIDETIEISDDDDQDEFSIESTSSASGADNADGEETRRRVYVKVSPASPTHSNSSPLQNGIMLTGSPAPVLSDWCDSQMGSDAATIIDEQLCVENQIIVNSDGDQIDIHTYVDNTPSVKPSRRQRGPSSNASQRKFTVLKRVTGAASTDDDEVVDVDSALRKPQPDRVQSNQKSSRSKVGSSRRGVSQSSNLIKHRNGNCGKNQPSNRNKVGSCNGGLKRSISRSNVSSSSSQINQPSSGSKVASGNCVAPQRPHGHKPSNSEVKLLRHMLEAPEPPTPAKARLYAKKTFSSPNYRKLIARRRFRREAAMSTAEFDEMDCESTSSNNLDHAYAPEPPDSPVHVADESSVSIRDYINIHPDLLGKPISPKKSPVTRFKPNILVKSCKAKDSSGNVIVVPLSRKKVSLPLILDKQFTTKQRLRCPSFVPPPAHPTSPSETVAEEVPSSMEASPVEEVFVSQLEDDASTETADDFGESPMDEEPSTSRRSSADSSTRLAIRSFASVHSFNDNCFSNMDRMLKF